MGLEGGASRLVEELLNRANVSLIGWGRPYPATNELLAAFLAWLNLSKRVSEIPTCLAAIAREHKVRGLVDPTKNSQI
ncbi:19122_t:CDS:2 [Dentiscutata erythropus]|uniref:19122_t:CDS:1 n=1 Tax=Dentiscutata erythropus TaxID=1348616 RepID=A0A9N9IWS5_9GLOM|nr:19122_t:CDS:2 [Dentiscutata erythropus]